MRGALREDKNVKEEGDRGEEDCRKWERTGTERRGYKGRVIEGVRGGKEK